MNNINESICNNSNFSSDFLKYFMSMNMSMFE